MKIVQKESQGGHLLKDWNAFKKGRIKFRTWKIDPATNKRAMSYENIVQMKKHASENLKKMRAKVLHLSQAELAKAIHVSKRTLQGWEIGRSVTPEPVLILCELLRDIPSVRKRLLMKDRAAA